VQLNQAGNYTVTVTNLYGSITSSNAMLTVLALPPTITLQPSNQAVYVGSTANLSVAATGSLPLSYQWNFNGTNIAGATNTTLTLTNVQFSQAGNYAMLVTNAYGSVLSSNASLMVMDHPPVAMPDTVAFLVGTPQVSFNVLSNDYDVDNDPLTVQSFTSPTRGALAQINNGQFTYQPNSSFTNGQDQFTYTITDGHGGTANAQVTINAYNRYLDGGDWPTLGNGPSHTGYYPGILGGSTLVAGWSTNLGGPLKQVAVGGGYVYVTQIGYPDGQHLTALNAVSGQAVWQFNFASAFSINPPTYDHGRVYVQRGNSSDSQLWCINAGDGSAVWSAPFGAQWESYYAPTVYGDGIWVDGGVYGGMYGFSTNGTQRFFNSTLAQFDQWTPTYYQGVVYSWVDGLFEAHDLMTGTNIWSLSLPWNWDGWSMNTVSAIDGGRAFVQQRPNLIAIDLTTHTNAWIADGGMTGSPAVAKGVVYAIFGNQVKAFAAQNGVSLGDYQAANDNGLAAQPIITDDALLVASSSSTYVFDLTSHQLIQTIPYGGTLSLANGRLYIAGQDGWLRVYTAPNIGPAVLMVVPFTGLTASGPVGGPFNPSSQVYSLVNNGGASLNWSVGQNANWIVLSGTNGSLAAGAVTNVTVGINSNANALAIGSYSANVTFTNLTNGSGTTNRVVALTVTLPPSCVPAPSGLVGWWPAEGNANDIAGTNNGTLVNSAGFAAGEVGQAFSFDGVNSYVSIPDSPSLDTLVSSITIETWIKFNQLTSDWEGIVTKGNSSWRLQATPWANTVYFAANGVGPTEDLYGSRNVRDGQWHHVAAVYDGTNMFLYVDGTVDVWQPATGLISQNNSPVCIGQTAESTGYFFDGLIDEVSIYNRALTASEIQAIYAAGSGGKCPPLTAPPAIITQPTNQTVTVGGTASFSVTASGTPPLYYQWSFNTTNIVGATNTTLMLTNVQLSPAGNYAVLVTNTYGSVLSSNAVLTVNPPAATVPVIFGFNPISGAVGTNVTISGTNFSPVASNNIVYFGALRAVVTGASVTNLVVTVPAGATYAPITETVGGLVAYANKAFQPTFLGNGSNISPSSFAPRVDLAGGNGPYVICIADLDGDGKPDLVAINYYDDNISLFRNISTNGSLTTDSFAPRVDLPSFGGAPLGLAVADVDGDGKLDLVVSDSSNNRVLVYRNISTVGTLTTNSFAAPVAFSAGNSPAAVRVRDLDGDGRPDIVCVNSGDNTLSILRNIGTAGSLTTNSFAAQVVLATGPNPSDLVIADLDGDGKPDLVQLNYTPSFFSVFRNTSVPGGIDTNSFAARVDFATPGEGNSIIVGDVDGDGKPDVIVGLASGSAISVYRNLASPGTLDTNSFAAEVDFAAPGLVRGVAMGDLNGDGKPDISLVGEEGDFMSIYQNVSTPGSFTNTSLAGRVDFGAGSDAHSVVIGDLDGDGRPDIIFVNQYDNTISIYQNEVPFGGAPPSITIQPTNQTVTTGGTAAFNVTASGTPPLRYQWNFNGTNIAGATNTTLTLTNVQASQAGNYTVLVTNLFGSLLSSNAVLTVTLDHFAWNPIPSPRFVNTPFAVVIRAQDMTNGLFTNYTGTAILGTTNGVAVTPPVSGNFIQGVWTGAVVISQTASNLVLRADDGLGHFGLANPINVLSLPRLGMLHSGNIALYMWPVEYSGFVLETSGNLLPATWVVVPYSPIQIGDQYLLPLDMTGTNGFYRLWFPGP
jgi:hypothetical protein